MSGAVASPEVRDWASVGSTAPSSPTTGAGTHPETWEERFSAAVPLFLVGSACFVVAVELYFSGTLTALGGSAVRLRPWILFIALGVTGLGAGITALFTEDSPTASGVSAEPVPAPDLVPDWDESRLDSVPRSSLGPLYAEEEGEDLGGPAAAALPADLVLSQLDEIEESLRRRSRSPPAVE